MDIVLTKSTKPQMYRKLIFYYGIYPMLNVLQLHEKAENFEECNIIKSVIDDLKVSMLVTLPTQLTSDAIDWCKKEFEGYSADFDTMLINLPQYIYAIILTVTPELL